MCRVQRQGNQVFWLHTWTQCSIWPPHYGVNSISRMEQWWVLLHHSSADRSTVAASPAHEGKMKCKVLLWSNYILHCKCTIGDQRLQQSAQYPKILNSYCVFILKTWSTLKLYFLININHKPRCLFYGPTYDNQWSSRKTNLSGRHGATRQGFKTEISWKYYGIYQTHFKLKSFFSTCIPILSWLKQHHKLQGFIIKIQ